MPVPTLTCKATDDREWRGVLGVFDIVIAFLWGFLLDFSIICIYVYIGEGVLNLFEVGLFLFYNEELPYRSSSV